MLKLLAYFDNQSIWYQLFRVKLSESSPGWLRKLITDDVNFEDAMRTLIDYCFLNIHTEQQSWSMHMCIHNWTLTVLNEEFDTQQYWYIFDCVAVSISENDQDLFDNIIYSRFIAHEARLVQQHFQQTYIIYDIVSDWFGNALYLAQLLKNQVWLVTAEQLYQRVLQEYEKTLDLNHTSILNTINNLGALYRDQKKLIEIEKIYQCALQEKEKTLDFNHTSILDTINNLDNLYSDQRKLVETEKIYQHAL